MQYDTTLKCHSQCPSSTSPIYLSPSAHTERRIYSRSRLPSLLGSSYPLLRSSLASPSSLFSQQGDEISGSTDPAAQTSTTDEKKNERTLYDVLGASSYMTRIELKRCYANAARRTHPDANINGNASNTDTEGPDFNEVANAWRILGNTKLRKRYDREIKAKEWSERAQKLTNERLEQGFDVASNILRRTSLALKVFNKNDQSNGTRQQQAQANLTQSFLNVVGARQDGGSSISTEEMSDKSDELERRAKKEEERATKISDELNQLTKQRLLATLQSPSVALTSDEAQTLLERLDINDTVSLVDRAMLKTTVENEISSLKETEELFSEKLQSYDETDKEWNRLLEEQEVAKEDLLQKKNLEIEARKTLERAQKGVIEAKENLVRTSNDLRVVEQQVRKTAQEMDQITTRLTKRQEKVRDALRKKTELMESGIQLKYLDEDEIAALRRKELKLVREQQEAEEMVTRLQSRAEKLKARADALDSWKSATKATTTTTTTGTSNGSFSPSP